MTDRQDDMVCLQQFARVQMKSTKPVSAIGAAIEFQIDDALLETILASQRLDLGSHVFNHGHEPECSDVRMGFGQDFGGRARRNKFTQHLAAEKSRVLDLAVELAVRKGASAAFAKLDIRFRIEFAP